MEKICGRYNKDQPRTKTTLPIRLIIIIIINIQQQLLLLVLLNPIELPRKTHQQQSPIKWRWVAKKEEKKQQQSTTTTIKQLPFLPLLQAIQERT